MVFHWSLSDGRSPRVSRTLPSILADLNNLVVLRISSRPLLSKSSSPWTNSLGIAPIAPITNGITSLSCSMFFQFSCKVEVLIFFFFHFYPVVSRRAKSTLQVLFFLLTFTKSCRLAEIRWSVCIPKSMRSWCVSFSCIDSGLLVLVSAFTLVGSNRLPPEQVQHSLFMLLIEENTLGFDWGKGPKSYPENALFAADFPQTHWQSDPRPPVCRNRHLLDFHQSSYSRGVALTPLGARPIRLGWSYQEPKFPTA